MTKITQVNCTTGEIIVRDATPEELLQKEADKIDALSLLNEIEKKQNQATEAKTTLQNKLAALGLSVDDLATLGL